MAKQQPEDQAKIHHRHREMSSRKVPRRQPRLVEAAAGVFEKKGYDATSMQDIANAWGVLRGSVYYYIDSKEELLCDAICGVHRSALVNLEAILGLDLDPITALRLACESHVRFVAANLAKANVSFYDFRALTGGHRDEVVAIRDRYEACITHLIERGQASGAINADLQPRLTTFAILGMLNWAYHWYRVDGEIGSSQLGASFADLALAAIFEVEAAASD